MLLVFILPVLLVVNIHSHGLAQQKNQPKKSAAAETTVVAAFRERVKQYVKLREEIEGKLPKLPPDSQPEKIEAHQKAFIAALQTARAAAQRGALFTEDVSAHIRQVIKTEFTGTRLKNLIENASREEVKGVPLKVNAPYPETKELLEMPPTLLLILPELPKQLRFRLVGRNLLLVDREAQLMLDYLPQALPYIRGAS